MDACTARQIPLLVIVECKMLTATRFDEARVGSVIGFTGTIYPDGRQEA